MAMAMAVTASQLASVRILSSSQQLSTLGSSDSSSSSSRQTWRTTGMPAIECAKHAQKKATAHHNKSRPKKHQPYDKNRKGPTYYPPLEKPPPIWGLDTGEVPEPEVSDPIPVLSY